VHATPNSGSPSRTLLWAHRASPSPRVRAMGAWQRRSHLLRLRRLRRSGRMAAGRGEDVRPIRFADAWPIAEPPGGPRWNPARAPGVNRLVLRQFNRTNRLWGRGSPAPAGMVPSTPSRLAVRRHRCHRRPACPGTPRWLRWQRYWASQPNRWRPLIAAPTNRKAPDEQSPGAFGRFREPSGRLPAKCIPLLTD
jgi:hypothetical protein